jgi:hypothetical protein
MRLILLLLPMQLITHPLPSVRVQKLEYHEHIRQKLNCILEIEDGSNYWDKQNRIESKELLIIKYLKR